MPSASLADDYGKSHALAGEAPALQYFSNAGVSACRQNASAYFAETDSITVALAPAGDCECVAVFEPFAGLAVRKLERVGAAPG